MFVAKDIKTGDQITSLNPVWGSRFEELRSWANSERLVCSGCAQTLRFRIGSHRRPHFAHRVLSECPLSRQSAEVLEAKAQLYEWLCTQYPAKVEMDVDLHVPEWERTADLVVRLDDGKVFSYWVFDHTPRNRSPLCRYVSRNESAHVLYTESARKLSDQGDTLLLPAALRDFIRQSLFDERHKSGHLYFLDTEHHQVLIYRGLDCEHSPNRYSWDLLHELDWTACKISPRTGEIVAAGETERKPKLSPVYVVREDAATLQISAPPRERSTTLADLAKAAQADNPPRRESPAPPRERSITLADLAKGARADNPPRREPPAPSKERTQSMTTVDWDKRPLVCELCGRSTTDYISAQPGLGICICRECRLKSSQSRLGDPKDGM